VAKQASSKPAPATNSASGKAKGQVASTAAVAGADAASLGADAMKTLFLRLGLLLLGIWVVGGSIAGFSQSSTVSIVALVVPALLSVAVVGVAIWGVRRTNKAKGVAGILAGVTNAEERQKALVQLDTQYSANDPAAIFAKAQLQMQEDPRQALVTLERIDLNKVMAAVGDEARAQRGLIHLMLGEATKARDLVDAIDLSRHQDARTRAMMSSVIAEAWARTGQANKALTVIEVFNPDDEIYAQVRPQLYRARAYAAAYTNDVKGMKRALRKMAEIDVRLLAAMLAKRVHPLLQKEIRMQLEQSGQMPRRMQIQR
jgi:hypothetical protein